MEGFQKFKFVFVFLQLTRPSTTTTEFDYIPTFKTDFMPELGLTSLFENLEQPNNDFKSMSTTFKYSPEPEKEEPKRIKTFSISRPKLSKTPKYSNKNTPKLKIADPEKPISHSPGKPIKFKNMGRTKLSTYAPVVCYPLYCF